MWETEDRATYAALLLGGIGATVELIGCDCPHGVVLQVVESESPYNEGTWALVRWADGLETWTRTDSIRQA